MATELEDGKVDVTRREAELRRGRGEPGLRMEMPEVAELRPWRSRGRRGRRRGEVEGAGSGARSGAKEALTKGVGGSAHPVMSG